MAPFWLLALFAPIIAVTAGPVHVEEYPEVIPGPGMPSLKSLGLTSADLHRMPLPGRNSSEWSIEKRSNSCQNNCVVSQSGAVACVNYLYNIGGNTCTVNTNTKMCQSGNAAIWGSAIGYNTESSQCGYVGNTAADIINHCTGCNGACVQGYETNQANAYFMVSIEGPNGNCS